MINIKNGAKIKLAISIRTKKCHFCKYSRMSDNFCVRPTLSIVKMTKMGTKIRLRLTKNSNMCVPLSTKRAYRLGTAQLLRQSLWHSPNIPDHPSLALPYRLIDIQFAQAEGQDDHQDAIDDGKGPDDPD